LLRVYACLSEAHDVRLVILAAAICFLSMWTAFVLAHQVKIMPGPQKIQWLLLLAFVTGAGIWATHFIAMLAYQPSLPTRYSPILTILSMAIAFCASGFAWMLLFSRMKASHILAGAAFCVGIGMMHFAGMAAFRTTGRLEYSPGLVAGALAFGALLSVAATFHFSLRERRPLCSAFVLTLAISTIHFGSMAAVSIIPDPRIALPPSTIDAHSLTIAIASLTLAIMAIALAVAIMEARLSRNAMEEAQRLKHFTQSAMEGLAILDGSRIIDANETFWCIAGHDPFNPPESLLISEVLPQHRNYVARGAGPAFVEQELRDAQGEMIDVETAIRMGRVGGVEREMVVVRDITQRKAAAERIAHLASHDPLTGVANRLSMARALDAALEVSSAENPFALLCLDLDRFKTVNDLHGHPAGDAVLIEVAHRIRACLKDGDLVARLGGDEFSILQPVGRQPHDAMVLAEHLIEVIAQPVNYESLVLSVGTSIGVALYPSNAATADDLHKKADLALYRAKADGRGIVRFFDEAMDRQLSSRHRMESDLREAVASNQFHLVYQPLACLETGGIVGFEALVRWKHPLRGDISPSDFISLAEDTGLIIPIGNWVLKEACREAARWKQLLKIAVNLSPAQIVEDGFVDIVKQSLSETGLDPHRLDLEVTEGLLVKDPARSLVILRELRALGVNIAMDDFGTGYSSLSYFRTFPFDKVKIDQTFVRDLADSREAMAIVKAIIGLGKGLGLSIVAEGVETMEQMDLLLAEGCHKIQGYLVSPPRPIEFFETIVLQRISQGHPCQNQCESCFERLRPLVGFRAQDISGIRISSFTP
jgi:diguanylate cyclase